MDRFLLRFVLPAGLLALTLLVLVPRWFPDAERAGLDRVVTDWPEPVQVGGAEVVRTPPELSASERAILDTREVAPKGPQDSDREEGADSPEPGPTPYVLRVVDLDGDPLPLARIHDLSGGPSYGLSDQAEIRTSVRPGDVHRFVARFGDVESPETEVHWAEALDPVVLVVQGRWDEGVLEVEVHGPDGAPLPGPRVAAFPGGSNTGNYLEDLGEGRHRGELPEGPYRLSVREPGFFSMERVVEVRADETERTVVRLERTSPREVLLLDASTGAPIAGTRVEFHPEGGEGPWPRSLDERHSSELVTDDGGRLRFDHVRAGVHRVEVRPTMFMDGQPQNGYRPADLVLAESGGATVLLEPVRPRRDTSDSRALVVLGSGRFERVEHLHAGSGELPEPRDLHLAPEGTVELALTRPGEADPLRVITIEPGPSGGFHASWSGADGNPAEAGAASGPLWLDLPLEGPCQVRVRCDGRVLLDRELAFEEGEVLWLR